MSQSQIDTRLTLDALNKVLGAMRRGTISPRISITRHPTQIVLSHVPDRDLPWVVKHFPGEREDRHLGIRKKGSQRFEEQRHVALLRPELEGHDQRSWDRAPRLEVWGLMVPHRCRSFDGFASKETGKVTWRCSAYNCRKKITKTAAREIGLPQP